MEKRPTSITVIAVIVIAFSLLGLLSAATLPLNPKAADMFARSPVPMVVNQIWGAVGSIVGLIVAYGAFKGQPWSRVLYLVFGIINLVVSLYISPIKYALVLGLVAFVVVCVFLWTNTANDWFQARGLMLSRERSRG